IKRFEVRLSPELLDGFFRRYYTIDTAAYKLAGKGKGRERRQTVVVFLSVLRHVLLSKNTTTTIIPISALVEYLNIENMKSFHQKEAINKVLLFIRDKADFPFNFEFISGNTG